MVWVASPVSAPFTTGLTADSVRIFAALQLGLRQALHEGRHGAPVDCIVGLVHQFAADDGALGDLLGGQPGDRRVELVGLRHVGEGG